MPSDKAIACALYVLKDDPQRVADYFNPPPQDVEASDELRIGTLNLRQPIQAVQFSAEETTMDIMIPESQYQEDKVIWVQGNMIGSGTYGVVFEAKPEDSDKYDFVMKLIPAEENDTNVIFEVYAQTKAAEMNISPKIYDWGRLRDGRKFIIMQKGGKDYTQAKYLWFVNSKDSGIPLDVYNYSFIHPKREDIEIDKNKHATSVGVIDLLQIYYVIAEFLYKYTRLEIAGIHHQDLFKRNIVQKPDSDEMWFIDFGNVEIRYPGDKPFPPAKEIECRARIMLERADNMFFAQNYAAVTYAAFHKNLREEIRRTIRTYMQL